MVEELGTYIPESEGQISESSNNGEQGKEAIQAAIANMEKNAKKAKQTRGQIQQQKKDNTKIAKFLAFLLTTIPNQLIHHLHLVFFSSDTGGPQKNINHRVIAGLFAPFYKKEITQFQLDELFDDILPKKNQRAVLDYTNYLKKLSYKFHDNIALNQQRMLQLIVDILVQYNIANPKDFQEEHKEDFLISITQQLFGIQHQIDLEKIKL